MKINKWLIFVVLKILEVTGFFCLIFISYFFGKYCNLFLKLEPQGEISFYFFYTILGFGILFISALLIFFLIKLGNFFISMWIEKNIKWAEKIKKRIENESK